MFCKVIKCDNKIYKMVIENLFKLFRIFPFVFVSYFLITGILGRQFKYFLVFLGLMISLFFTSMISKTEAVKNFAYKDEENGAPLADDKIIEKIKKFSIFSSDFTPVTYLPLSVGIYSFVLFYYLYALSASAASVWTNNWGIIVILIILLGMDYGWFKKGGFSHMAISIPAIVGLVTGILWAMIIGKTNWAIPTGDANSTCKPQDMKYSCKLSTDGALIT
jgi:hypothetical protein